MLIDFQNKIYVGSAGRKSVFDFQLPVSPKGVVIFVHGYKGYKDWGAWNLVQNYVVEAGFGFVKFNVSHNGGTVEDPIDFPDLEAFGRNTYSFELNDLTGIIDETYRIIHQECALEIPIFLVGHSRGGGIVTLAAANNPKIDKIVSWAGISDIASRFPSGEKLEDWRQLGVLYVENQRTKQAMPHYFSFYEDFKQNEAALSIEKAAKDLQIPFKQIHGDMDLSVSISEGQNLANWTTTDLSIIKGADHTFGAQHPWNQESLPEDLLKVIKITLLFLDDDLEKNR